MATMVIANRHEIASAGIVALLQGHGHHILACCSQEDDFLCSVEAYHPDIVTLAENIARQKAAITVSRVRNRNRSVAIIFMIEERAVITAVDLLSLDVNGILSNAACASSVVDCVESVCRGRKWIDPDLLHLIAKTERSSHNENCLTAREADIAYLVTRGLRNKEIAHELLLSEGTVKMHLHHIYEKLRLSGRTQLALSMASVKRGNAHIEQ